MHNYPISMQNCFLICFNSGFVNKSGHKYFDRSGLFLQIRSHIEPFMNDTHIINSLY